jgi:hypothetical protein
LPVNPTPANIIEGSNTGPSSRSALNGCAQKQLLRVERETGARCQLSQVCINALSKADYDLRTVEEKERHPDELPSGVNYIWLDVLADFPQAGPAQLEPLMKDPKKANAALGGGKAAGEISALRFP